MCYSSDWIWVLHQKTTPAPRHQNTRSIRPSQDRTTKVRGTQVQFCQEVYADHLKFIESFPWHWKKLLGGKIDICNQTDR